MGKAVTQIVETAREPSGSEEVQSADRSPRSAPEGARLLDLHEAATYTVNRKRQAMTPSREGLQFQPAISRVPFSSRIALTRYYVYTYSLIHGKAEIDPDRGRHVDRANQDPGCEG